MRKLIIAAGLAAGLGAGAIAYASVPDSQGVIHGCRKLDNGGVRVIESGSCRAGEAPLDWVQSAGYEVFRSGPPFDSPVEITAVQPQYEHVMTLDLPPGSYHVATTLRVSKGSGDGVLRCVTFTSPAFATSIVQAALGTDPGDSRLTTLSGAGLVALPEGGTAEVECRQQAGASGPNPVVDLADISAVRIGAVTQGPGS